MSMTPPLDNFFSGYTLSACAHYASTFRTKKNPDQAENFHDYLFRNGTSTILLVAQTHFVQIAFENSTLGSGPLLHQCFSIVKNALLTSFFIKATIAKTSIGRGNLENVDTVINAGQKLCSLLLKVALVAHMLRSLSPHSIALVAPTAMDALVVSKILPQKAQVAAEKVHSALQRVSLWKLAPIALTRIGFIIAFLFEVRKLFNYYSKTIGEEDFINQTFANYQKGLQECKELIDSLLKDPNYEEYKGEILTISSEISSVSSFEIPARFALLHEIEGLRSKNREERQYKLKTLTKRNEVLDILCSEINALVDHEKLKNGGLEKKWSEQEWLKILKIAFILPQVLKNEEDQALREIIKKLYTPSIVYSHSNHSTSTSITDFENRFKPMNFHDKVLADIRNTFPESAKAVYR